MRPQNWIVAIGRTWWLVKYFGFASTDVRMLSDKRASKKAIVDGLKALCTGA